MIRLPRSFGRLLLAVTVFATLGCGGGQADFTGRVTYKGKPLHRGSITIVGADKKVLVAAIGEDGTFSFQGVPSGTVKIGILCPEPRSEMPSNQSDLGKKLSHTDPIGASSVEDRRKWSKIPSVYGEPETSGLTAEISRPATMKEITLTD